MSPNVTFANLVKSDGFEHCGEADDSNIVFGTMLLLLGIITVIGNTCTAMSYILCKKIRQLTLNTYIFSLAISDLGMGIFVFLCYSIWEFHGKPVLTSAEVYLWNSMFRLCLYLSVSSVTLMTHDRYIMVAYPIKYRQRGRIKYAWIKLVIVWVLGIVFSFFLETYALKIVDKVPYACRRNWFQPDEFTTTVKVLMLFIDFFLPLTVIAILNTMVFFKIWKGSRVQIERNMANLGFTKRSLNHRFWSQWKDICTSHCASMWKIVGREKSCHHFCDKTAKDKTKLEESFKSSTVVSTDSCQTCEIVCPTNFVDSELSFVNAENVDSKSVRDNVATSPPGQFQDDIVNEKAEHDGSLDPKKIILIGSCPMHGTDSIHEQVKSDMCSIGADDMSTVTGNGTVSGIVSSFDEPQQATVNEKAKNGVTFNPSTKIAMNNSVVETDYPANLVESLVEVDDKENRNTRSKADGALSSNVKAQTDVVNKQNDISEAISMSKRQAMTLLQKRLSQEHKRLRKAATSLFIFVIVYFICWAPFYITSTVACFIPLTDALQKAQTITSVILWCNSLVNPFLYAAMSQAYRDFLRDLVCKFILRRNG